MSLNNAPKDPPLLVSVPVETMLKAEMTPRQMIHALNIIAACMATVVIIFVSGKFVGGKKNTRRPPASLVDRLISKVTRLLDSGKGRACQAWSSVVQFCCSGTDGKNGKRPKKKTFNKMFRSRRGDKSEAAEPEDSTLTAVADASTPQQWPQRDSVEAPADGESADGQVQDDANADCSEVTESKQGKKKNQKKAKAAAKKTSKKRVSLSKNSQLPETEPAAPEETVETEKPEYTENRKADPKKTEPEETPEPVEAVEEADPDEAELEEAEVEEAEPEKADPDEAELEEAGPEEADPEVEETEREEMLSEAEELTASKVHREVGRALRAIAKGFAEQGANAPPGGVDTVFSVMDDHADSLQVQLEGMRALEAGASGSPVIAVRLISLGVLDLINDRMATWPSDAAIKALGCKVMLHASAADADSRAKVVEFGCITKTLDSMRAHPAAVTVQEAGCRLLKELAARDVANQAEIIDNGGIQDVLAAMAKHERISQIQKVACGVLRNVAPLSAQRQAEIALMGAIPCVLKAMLLHKAAPAVQCAGCWALVGLAAKNPANAARICSLGGLRSAIGAMEKHEKAGYVQEAGCWTIKELVASTSFNPADPIAVECYEAVMRAKDQAMAPAVTKACQLALHALWLCTCALPADDAFSAATKRRPVERQIWAEELPSSQDPEALGTDATVVRIEAVLTLMAGNSNTAKSMEEGCKVLQKLAAEGLAMQDAIGELGGFSTVIYVMRTHEGVRQVQREGLRALEALTSQCAANSARLLGILSVESLIEIMTKTKDVAIQESGCKIILHAVVEDVESHAAVVEGGGIRATLEGMANHPFSAPLQSTGCKLLKELINRSPESLAEIVGSGGLQGVLQAMGNHPTIAHVQEAACGVLRSVAAGNADHQASIIALGGVQKVLYAMHYHAPAPRVQCAGCWTLVCLAVKNPEAKSTIVAFGGLRAALHSMERHEHAPNVQEAGCWAVKELVSCSAFDPTDPIAAACHKMVVRATAHNAQSPTVVKACQLALHALSLACAGISPCAELP